MIGILLEIAKVGGMVILILSTVIATFGPPVHEKKLTKIGKTVVFTTILGTLLAVLSLVFEDSSNEATANKMLNGLSAQQTTLSAQQNMLETQQTTLSDQQKLLAKQQDGISESLKNAKRILGLMDIDRLNAQIYFKVPLNDPVATTYLDRLRTWQEAHIVLSEDAKGSILIDDGEINVWTQDGNKFKPNLLAINPGSTLYPSLKEAQILRDLFDSVEIKVAIYRNPIDPKKFVPPPGKPAPDCLLAFFDGQKLAGINIQNAGDSTFQLFHPSVRRDITDFSDPALTRGTILSATDLAGAQLIAYVDSKSIRLGRMTAPQAATFLAQCEITQYSFDVTFPTNGGRSPAAA